VNADGSEKKFDSNRPKRKFDSSKPKKKFKNKTNKSKGQPRKFNKKREE
jgi:hypothetical protein